MSYDYFDVLILWNFNSTSIEGTKEIKSRGK